MTLVDRILERLEKVRQTNNGWRACCPAHDDRHPSLSVAVSDGKVLLNCHAGCSIDRICRSLGITPGDLFFDAPGSGKLEKQPRSSAKHKRPAGFASRDEAVRAVVNKTKGQLADTWTYHDRRGNEVFAVVRIDVPGGKKTFRPIHPSEGRWYIGDPAGPLPLYRLPEIADADRVWVTEGEKAAEAARSIGLAATTSAHGSRSAAKSDWTPLAGKRVILLPDNDGAGRQYAEEVARILSKLTPPPDVSTVALPDLPEGGDIVEWIDAHGDAADPDELVCQLERFVDGTRVVCPVNDESAEDGLDDSDPWPDPLGEEAFHGLAGTITRTIEPHSEADPAALLVQLLAAFGNLVGRTAHFVAEADRHYGNLFITLVGTTSKGRKGSSWGQVRRLIELVDPDWCGRNIGSGLSSGEGLIWAVRDEVVRQEPLREGNKRTGPITGYQDVVVDQGIADKRLLMLEGEFASVLHVCSRDKNTLSAVIRQAWDTGDLRSLVKNTPTRATGAHVSVIGHITRQELRQLITATDLANGVANRFLWMCVRRSKALPEGGNLRQEDLVPLAEQLRDAVEFAKHVGELRRDEQARAVWRDIYPQLSAGKPGLLGAATSRAESQTMRLAMLYALLDRSHVIRAEHLMGGLAVWTYAEQSARYIFGSAMGDPAADEILERLRGESGGLTRTQIRDHFGRHQAKARIDDALRLLRDSGLVRCEQTDTGGRPAQRWFACA